MNMVSKQKNSQINLNEIATFMTCFDKNLMQIPQ